jgi:putative ABC transport system permease protein
MFGRRSQRDFEDEVRSHLELEIERLRGEGMSEADAERAARRAFGNEIVAGDRFHEGQRFASVDDAVRDLKHAWRALLRTPGFLAAAVVTLALAMGATAGMFNVVNTVMLAAAVPERGPAGDRGGHARRGRTCRSASTSARTSTSTTGSDSQLIDGICSSSTAARRRSARTIAWSASDGVAVDRHVCDAGRAPQLGRLPVPEDGDGVVVISDQLWSSWFGRDPSVIGGSYFVSDGMKQIIGIMPPEFRFPSDNTMLWVAGEVRPSR